MPRPAELPFVIRALNLPPRPLVLDLCCGAGRHSRALVSAVLPEEQGVYELAKMAVTPEYRGRGISKLLIDACLQAAKNLRAKKITLFSNHQLTTALSLYEKYGFKNVEVKNSPFATADVKMELIL